MARKSESQTTSKSAKSGRSGNESPISSGDDHEKVLNPFDRFDNRPSRAICVMLPNAADQQRLS